MNRVATRETDSGAVVCFADPKRPVQDTPPIAFLYPAFPVLHQTFVMWEALALRKLGLRMQLFSLQRPPVGKQQPEAAALLDEVVYLPSLFSPRVLWANVSFFSRNPHRYVSVLAKLLQEWWRDRAKLLAQRRQAPRLQVAMSWKVRLERLWNTSPLVFLVKTLGLVPRAVLLGELLQRNGVRRVHAHWATHATTVALLVRWLFGLRFSFTAHAYDIYLMPLFLPVKLQEADLVVTCAKVNAEYLRSLCSGQQHKIVVNYHGVDVQRFSPRPRERSGPIPQIVTCGALRVYKGHHVLIEACSLLRRPVRCVIIGEGPQRRVLEKQARELGVAERIEFTGALVQEEVARRYAEADLFVLASIVVEESGRQDVIPNVLVEAMSMGMAVVASALPGIKELIEDGVHGRLVPPGDAKALATAIEQLLDDPVARSEFGRRGRQRVLESFDREKNVRDLAFVLQRGVWGHGER
jgi:glycosyltransferase involved in cell wall biosynthesis